jgi:hypothetical protein
MPFSPREISIFTSDGVESFEHDKITNKKRAVNKGYEFLIIEKFIKTIPPIGGIELV